MKLGYEMSEQEREKQRKQEDEGRKFPGGPVVKTPCFHCRGHRFNPWWGNQDLTCCKAWQKQTNKQRERLEAQ